MRLTLILITIITLCQLVIMILTYDTWRMDKQFFEDNQEPEEQEEVGIDKYV